MNFDDLPMIQLRPGPTDAELAADRERKYQAELAKPTPCGGFPFCECGDCDWPIGEVTA